MTASTTQDDLSQLSGLEQLRRFGDSAAASTGIGALLGMRMTELEEGKVVFEADTRPDFANPLGTVHGGVTATLIDSAMACAVHSALPPGASYTTVDLALTYVRAVSPQGRLLRAEGRVVHLGGRIATAEGRVVDGKDRLVATATTTCMVFRGRSATQ